MMNINKYWKDVLDQNEKAIRTYFDDEAYVNWHCTNEHFSVDEFIVANCQYPGEWTGNVERVEEINDTIITITRVGLKDNSISFHVTSFFKMINNKIVSIDEYWAEDGQAPIWRLEMHVEKPIH